MTEETVIAVNGTQFARAYSSVIEIFRLSGGWKSSSEREISLKGNDSDAAAVVQPLPVRPVSANTIGLVRSEYACSIPRTRSVCIWIVRVIPPTLSVSPDNRLNVFRCSRGIRDRIDY